MAENQEDRLCEADKIEELLAGGLEEMDAGGRQMLLVMAETKVAEGYRPTPEENRVVEKLCAMAGQDYDAKDIRRKVRKMVKSPTKADTPGLSLPPAFDHLLSRLRRARRNAQDNAD